MAVTSKIASVKANSQVDAIEKADKFFSESVRINILAESPTAGLPIHQHTECAEEIVGYLVDEVGDEEFTKTQLYNSEAKLTDQIVGGASETKTSKYQDQKENIDVIWEALGNCRENLIPEGDESYDKEWDNICHAMALLQEALNIVERDHESYSCLVCSTGHLKQTGLRGLEEMAAGGDSMVMARDTGLFIKLYEEEKYNNRPEYCAELLTLIQFAQENGHKLIELDCDAETLPIFPVYDG